MPFPRIIVSSLVPILLLALPGAALADAGGRSVFIGVRSVELPAGTPVVAELTAPVTSRKKDASVGELVRARVAQDVVVDGEVLVEEGAELMLGVAYTRKAKILGRRGHLQLRGVSVRAVDGSILPLDGFYMRRGKGRKLVAATLTAAVAWPFAFLRGKHAVVPQGTLFETYLAEAAEVSPRNQWAILDMTQPYR